MDDPEQPLLGPDDPAPVALINAEGRAPLVLTAEHGGRAVPGSLAHAQPSAEDMGRHIAYDVGVAELASGLSERLDAALALQPYSRLVIDCNRPRHAADLAPPVSDGSPIPFNRALGQDVLENRWRTIHQPFHQTVAGLLDRRDRPVLLAVHSFTRQLKGQAPRSMAIGLLARQDMTFARILKEDMLAIRDDLEIVFDAPYQIEDDSDYTIPTHGEGRNIPHLLLEVRNDLLTGDGAAILDWLALALSTSLERLR